MRAILVRLHRWVGLGIAGFLFVSGLSGAIIAWEGPLDAALNPHLFAARTDAPALPPLDLAARLEARDPRARVTELPLRSEPGAAAVLRVSPRPDPATGRPYALGYDQVFLDPATGEENGRRLWGRGWPITREGLIPSLYVLHYAMQIPAVRGLDRLGIWFMGAVAALWTLDCLVGLLLTLPPRRVARRDGGPGRWRRWAPAWRIKAAGAYRITFDLHRAGALWSFGLLAVLASTAFTQSFTREIFLPALSAVTPLTPGPLDGRPALPEPIASRDAILAAARADGLRRGFGAPGALVYDARHGAYAVRFPPPGETRGLMGAKPDTLFYDGADGRPLGALRPWTGTAGDLFAQAQFPLHSGRILGLPGRILISVAGVVVALLSATGVLIWLRKRAARRAGRRPTRGLAAA